MPYVVECLYLNSAFRGQKFVNYTELEIKQLLYSTETYLGQYSQVLPTLKPRARIYNLSIHVNAKKKNAV